MYKYIRNLPSYKRRHVVADMHCIVSGHRACVASGAKTDKTWLAFLVCPMHRSSLSSVERMPFYMLPAHFTWLNSDHVSQKLAIKTTTHKDLLDHPIQREPLTIRNRTRKSWSKLLFTLPADTPDFANQCGKNQTVRMTTARLAWVYFRGPEHDTVAGSPRFPIDGWRLSRAVAG